MSVSLEKVVHPPVRADRRDLGQHITEVFADLEVGAFLTAAQIGNGTSSVYGESKPSTGAIIARLFPNSGTCTLPGVRPDFHPETGARGAMKVAEFTVNGERWQTGPVVPQV